MWTETELKLIKKQNYNRVKELVRISFGLGVNLTSPSTFKESLKIINVILLASSIFSMYSHICQLMRYRNDILKIAEAICTALQTIISIVKLFYFLFAQHKFYKLFKQAQTHELLTKIEVFSEDFGIKEKIKKDIDAIMEVCWRSVRRQLVFYICCCTGIISNYFFSALFINLYHQFKETPDYTPMLPFPVVYPIWEDKGMTFPYYHIQMYLGGAAVYIAGMGAVSFDGLFIVLSMHAVGLIKVLNMMLQHSTSPLTPPAQRVEYLRICIYHYQRTWDYILEIERLFQHLSLTQFILSLLVFGIVLFEMSVGLESDWVTLLRMLMYISAAGYEIVIYCYNGQTLATEAEKIPLALYNCIWYEESRDFKTLLRMMIMRSNRTFYFKVSWFSTMSLPTFMSMVRSSGSYFLLLRNLTGK